MSPDPFPNLVEKLGDNLYLSPEVVQWLEAKGCFYASYVDEALCAYIKTMSAAQLVVAGWSARL
jgi:hypothetical protein